MTWFGWTLVAFFGLTSLLTINGVGEARKPTTPGIATATVVLAGLIVWGVLAVGTGSLSQ